MDTTDLGDLSKVKVRMDTSKGTGLFGAVDDWYLLKVSVYVVLLRVCTILYIKELIKIQIDMFSNYNAFLGGCLLFYTFVPCLAWS